MKFSLYADNIFPRPLQLPKKKKKEKKRRISSSILVVYLRFANTTKFLEYPWNQSQRVTISRSSCRINSQQNFLRFCLKNRTILEKRYSLNFTLSVQFRHFIPCIFPLSSISQFHFRALCSVSKFHSSGVLRSIFQAELTRCLLSTKATPVTENSARSTPLNARYRSDNIDSSLRLGPMQSDNASTTMLTKTMGESTCSPTTDGAKGFTRVSITRGSQHPASQMFA